MQAKVEYRDKRMTEMKQKIKKQNIRIKEQEKQISFYDNSIEKNVRVSNKKIKTATDAETNALNLLQVRTQQFDNCINTSRETAHKLKATVTKQKNETQLLKEKLKKKQAMIKEYTNQKRTMKGNIREHQQQLSEKEKLYKKITQ